LPRKLEDIAQQLLGREKDKVGRRVTLQLGRPGKDGRLRPVTPEQMTTVVGYCRSDVELLAEAWRVRLGRWLEVESDVRALDVQINERGFLFDVELAQGIIECEAEALAKLSEQLRIDPAIVRSSPKLISALAQSGVRVDNIRNETLEPLLADPSLPPEARRLIGARVAYIGMATPKLRAALARLDVDGRLKDTLVFHGAHTGRWSGQGFQPQNLPHGARDLNVETAVRAALARDHERLQALAQELQVTVTDVTAKLVRACVIAPASKLLAVVDYSSVEPRALAWVAGNESRLKDFRDGVDIYKPMASKILGVPVDKLTKAQRNVGKPPELGCGYGMGGSRFGEYAESFGVAWSVMPMTPEQVVEMWRDENPLVAGVRDTPFGGRRGGLWQRLENAALRACQGERVTVACTAWERDGEDVVCILPSGRRMVYRCALGERVQTRWGSTREAMTFLMVDKGRVVRKSTYGGLLTENVIQAICRDVLVDAMLRLDPAGFELVLHVHDEPVAEVTDAARLEKMKEILATPPAWAAGLPLAVEGYVSRRYRGK
jgi:DNA polymerase